MSCDEELDLDLLGRESLHFRRRVLELAADEELRVDADAWRDVIVFLETGEVELECVAGERRRFVGGATLCFPPVVRFLRNPGGDRARLLVISRRTGTRSKLTG